jgi:acyl-CoA reductase LuxC
MITALIEVGKKWQEVDYPFRKEAIRTAAPEFCLSPAHFEFALKWIFSFWNKETLYKIQNENKYKNISNLVQVLAGNTPAVIAQAFLHGALIHAPQKIKIPSLQPTFPQLLQASFNDVSTELGALFHLDTWKNNLTELYSHLSKADLVIAYGNDKTITQLKNYCSPNALFVPQGHAVSCAILFKAAANRKHLAKLAWDMLIYDQRGCLSPRAVFVEQGGELSPLECASVFAKEILPTVASQLPRGGLFPGEAAAIIQRRAVYGFHGVTYPGEDWTVCYDDELIWPEEILPRFMPFKPFSTIQALENVLKPIQHHLISIGVEGNDNIIFNYPKLKHVCKLGEMQKQLLGF